MARFSSGPMIATVLADYVRAHGVEGSAKRLRGGKEVMDVEAEQTWIEVPLKPPCAGWAVAARIGLQEDGALAISELRIFPRESPMMSGEEGPKRPPGLWSAELLGYRAPFPPGGLTSTVLRKIGLRWLLRFAAQQVSRWERQVKTYYGRLLDYGTASGLIFELRRGKRGRPRQYDDTLLLRAARLYTKGISRTGSVRRFVADELEVSPERARDIVKTARARGFLGAGIPGRVGGMLTPQAEALVKSLRRGSRRGSSRRLQSVGR